MKSHSTVAIGLGANIGDKSYTLFSALSEITKEVGSIQACSPLFTTQAVLADDLEAQPDYYNAAILVSTILIPEATLTKLQQIEVKLGRIRTKGVRWEPRTLDLDILLFDDITMRSAHLTIPHPLMERRSFVLEPLSTIAPDWIHPVRNKTIIELLRML